MLIDCFKLYISFLVFKTFILVPSKKDEIIHIKDISSLDDYKSMLVKKFPKEEQEIEIPMYEAEFDNDTLFEEEIEDEPQIMLDSIPELEQPLPNPEEKTDDQ